jgi:hypothetical protein
MGSRLEKRAAIWGNRVMSFSTPRSASGAACLFWTAGKSGALGRGVVMDERVRKIVLGVEAAVAQGREMALPLHLLTETDPRDFRRVWRSGGVAAVEQWNGAEVAYQQVEAGRWEDDGGVSGEGEG